MSISLDRRRLLRTLGLGVVAGAPVFRRGRLARAEGAIPKRFFAALMYNGTVPANFWPASGSLASAALPEILKPLEPFKSKLLVIRGLRNGATGSSGGAHGAGQYTVFTGTRYVSSAPSDPTAGISIDQHIADTIWDATKPTKFKSLQLGTPESTASSWRAALKPMPPMMEPDLAFDRIFGGLAGGSGADPAALERLRFRRKSVFDHVSKELAALSAKLSGADREKLNANLESIRDIERRLTALTTSAPGATAATCQKPARGPAVPCAKRGVGSYNVGTCPGYPKIATEFHIDMIAAAFRCDLTRVATMNWHKGTSEQTFPWLNIPNIGHHTFSHFPLSDIIAMSHLSSIGRWHQEMLARLYAQMDAVKEVDGQSMLHHSVCIFQSEIGVGNSHTIENIPTTVVGTGGGYFASGRSLALPGRNTNDLFAACANAFGSPVTKFGNPGLAMGPLPLA